MLWQAILGGILGRLLSEEIAALFPYLTQKLIRYHVSKLPSELADRMLEEWTANLQIIPGNIGKLFFALDLFRATRRITYEFKFDMPYKPWTDTSIRFLDLLYAGTNLFIVLPIFFVLSFLIKLESRESAFHLQDREGKDGRTFKLLTFRLMRQREYKIMGTYIRKNNSCLMRVGRFLLKTSLDQLPILINILKGEVSFVGPRPLSPEFMDRLTTSQREKLLAFRPALIQPVHWEQYIEERSLSIYIETIFRGIWSVFYR